MTTFSLEKRLNQKITVHVSVTAVTLTLFTLCLAFFAYVQFGTDGLAGNDGYYHMKMGYLLRTEGLRPVFDQLPLTILQEGAFYDHHLLYHLYLALFALVDPVLDGGAQLTWGAKWASVVLPSLAFMSIWWLLHSQKVTGAMLWTIALFALSSAFLYRMSMPRAQALSLLLLVLGMGVLLNGRYPLLLPLGFLYVWAYNAFPLLLVLAGVYVVAVYVCEQRWAWQAVVYPAVGIGLGLIINPYFPENLTFIVQHILPKLAGDSIRVGNEWYPYRTWTLMENSGWTAVILVVGLLAMGWHKERIDTRTLFALLIVLLFGGMLLKSRRFIEYVPPFVLIFTAFSVQSLLNGQSWLNGRWQQLTQVGLLFLCLVPIGQTVTATRQQLAEAKPSDRYAEATLWLHNNVPAGERVFQTDWDDFTRLFFYDDHHQFIVGLDPTYLQLADEPLYEQWVQVTQGKVENPSQIIQTQFNADYVFSDLNHQAFIAQADADPRLVQLYKTNDAVIYGIVD